MQVTQARTRTRDRAGRIDAIERALRDSMVELRNALAELGRLRAEMHDETGHVVTANANTTITPVLGSTGAGDVAGGCVCK